MRWLDPVVLLLLAGCSTTREITISARPSDATIAVDDGAQKGMGRLIATITFKGGSDVHTVKATRPGYQDKTVSLHRDDPANSVEIDLDPFHRLLTFATVPIPADVFVDGSPITSGPVSQASTVQNFIIDDQGNWTHHDVVASRLGWEPAKITVTWTDASPDYVLQLQPKRKDVTITTNPPGAAVSIDGTVVGPGPAVVKALAFPFDNISNEFPQRRVIVSKAGYDPVQRDISWDNGKTDYQIDLIPHRKIVRILTNPGGATVTIDGKTAPAGPDGVPAIQLSYVPVNDAGDLPVFTATISKQTAETEWYPSTLPIPWDDGRSEYSVTLREIMTRNVPLTNVELQRDADGIWQIVPRVVNTVGMKDVSEGPGKEPPTLIFQAPKGSSIGTLAVNPNGGQIVFTLLSGSTKLDVHSQILALDTTGPGSVQEITDGKSLDLMPAFTADGTQIVYSSNRAGRCLNVWRKSLEGAIGIDQLSYGNEQDLWPMIDAAPKPRLFYEVLSDSQPDPQLYMAPVEGSSRTDLATIPVTQPRISPRADAILFTSVNQRTGNREIYRISDHGGAPIEITNDPDSECYDPAWSKDGSMMAFVSDRAYATYPVLHDNQVVEERHRNADVWIVDLTHSDKPEQITTNGSVDDCPAWDPSGDYIYFRSNRGGQWGIWKIPVK
jgi:Tol biopolymer transport system component